MALKPWYTVIPPREDLRSGKPLDASEFAVHLDQVRDERAPIDYRDPERFFERTYLTQTLLGLGSEVVRRLSGETTETSAVFNLSTQFGGGKTHALTLLYHLAKHGKGADHWPGVQRMLEKGGVASVPDAAVAVFVGTEFDSLTGRGGTDGTPLRRTPWGEIAYQLGGAPALAVLSEHEEQFVEPKGDVIRAFLPKDKPCLILMDEIINYVSTYRRKGYGNALYIFIQALSETARGMKNVVLVVSIPASVLDYTAEDIDDERRFKRMLDRLGKAYMMSAESETSEIIRRRLFEWDLRAVGQNGRIALPKEALNTCNDYADWVVAHRQSLPQSFPIDSARDAFAATYPFHPMVLSVFERKWQSLPRFQQTRGMLRLLALWVSKAYREGFTGAFRDPLIDLGTAPLDDAMFRAAAFEQLGESKLEVPVTTDICGKKDSHAARLDEEASDTIKRARLHRKVATAIFFESNGGQAQSYATLPEVRMSVAAPTLDIANVETVLEALVPPNGVCYYLDANKNRYWFSTKPNLSKLLADRKASVPSARIDERVRTEIEKVFSPLPGTERIFFPTASGHIPNQPVLTLVILAPDQAPQDSLTLTRLEAMTREAGNGSRTFKSALLWVLADGDGALREEARKLLAWEAISDEKDDLALDEVQKKQIDTNFSNARRDLRESVWRAYNHIAMLGKDNDIQVKNLGLVHSSS
ncbi:MAG: ATP-binding protein, partial [Chloroflexia bacterium]|nr:ATP-binding protein [Chloroflexia bacterium]